MELNSSFQTADATVYEGEAGGFYAATGPTSPAIPQGKLAAGKLVLHPRGFAPPHYSDTFNIGYVAQGSGRVQIMGLNGTRALDADVQEDQAFVVPKIFVATQLAGERGMEFFCISTSSRPIVGQLAGQESVWKALSSLQLFCKLR
ncbi:hypothetical protein Salat_0163500 [Sesamum alatum]|uniref:Cupin type-1 domain-containing protein n=1 Tax=Sesamum alatum TaxID=300844 RepID=A0AAE1YY82_9LAMI|nr:hypothetical protein Salat_0163500 [Sesamum alatum]